MIILSCIVTITIREYCTIETHFVYCPLSLYIQYCTQYVHTQYVRHTVCFWFDEELLLLSLKMSAEIDKVTPPSTRAMLLSKYQKSGSALSTCLLLYITRLACVLPCRLLLFSCMLFSSSPKKSSLSQTDICIYLHSRSDGVPTESADCKPPCTVNCKVMQWYADTAC